MRWSCRETASVAVCLVALLGFGACSWSIGESRDETAHVHPTLGEELRDLQRAHDDGAITDTEFDAAKRKLLSEDRPVN